MSIRVKLTGLCAVRKPEEAGERFINHLCACLDCLMIVIKQRGPLCEAGCPEFLRLLQESKAHVDAARSPLANLHVTEAILEEYCFNRLTFVEVKVLEAHLIVCHACAVRLEHRRSFIDIIRAALVKEPDLRPQGVTGLFAFDGNKGTTDEITVVSA